MTNTLAGPTREHLNRLRETFGGEVITPADVAYDDARRVWNAVFDRRPALLVRPTSVEDVATAIRFGRERGLEIAVRCGGPQQCGALDHRRWARHRPVAAARRDRRSGASHRSRRRRRAPGRTRRRCAGARPRLPGRRHRSYGGRRTHPWRWDGPAPAALRPDHRQPSRCRAGNCRRPHGPRE